MERMVVIMKHYSEKYYNRNRSNHDRLTDEYPKYEGFEERVYNRYEDYREAEAEVTDRYNKNLYY